MVFASDLLFEIKNVLFATSQKPSLLWQIAPIMLLWVVLEIYFGRYNKEKFGWNTALGNGITMFWIVISSVQFMFSNYKTGDFYWSSVIAVSLICFYSISIIIISFKHSLKSKITYLLASPTPVNYFSIISLLIAHNTIRLTLSSISAILVLFFLFMIFFFIFRLLIPNSKNVDDDSFSDDLNDFEPSKPKKSKKKDKDSFSDLPGDLEKELDSSFSDELNKFPDETSSNSPPIDDFKSKI